jgi:DNA-binding transcriptional ArsR family regulator
VDDHQHALTSINMYSLEVAMTPRRGHRTADTDTRSASSHAQRDPAGDSTGTLLEFFKALADANRLTIVGVLARSPRSVDQIAAALSLDSSTVSHHLKRLARVGLVCARAEGPYSVYELDRGALERLARELLADDTLPKLAVDADLSAFDRKVLDTFVGPDGRFTAFPSQHRKYMVLVRHAAAAFEHGERYGEREVNERLARYHDDTARLRRSLVDAGIMGRARDGSRYWLIERPAAS